MKLDPTSGNPSRVQQAENPEYYVVVVVVSPGAYWRVESFIGKGIKWNQEVEEEGEGEGD